MVVVGLCLHTCLHTQHSAAARTGGSGYLCCLAAVARGVLAGSHPAALARGLLMIVTRQSTQF